MSRSSVRTERGFTYVWTLMLVAMLGSGLVMAAETYSMVAAREREAQLLFVGHEFRQAIERYHNAQAGGANRQYPETLEQLLHDTRFPGTRRYLRRIYVDPMIGKAEWGIVRVGGRIVGVHSLSQQPTIKRKNFDLDDVAFESAERYEEWVFTYPPQLLLEEGDAAPRVTFEGEKDAQS